MASCITTRRSRRPCACVETSDARTGRSCCPPLPTGSNEAQKVERLENVNDGKTNMNDNRNSDESIVPATSANNGGPEPPTEPNEERVSTKSNDEQTDLPRTPGRIKRKSLGLHGVREAARKDSQLKFTALLHHVNHDLLLEAFFNLKKTAAVGVDAVTWHEYERDVGENIADLHDRVHRGAYRAKPSLRIWIPKADGRQRPIGIASLEDKIVQQAVQWVLQSVYEQDFVGFSYGFRPDRSQHNALDALSVAICDKRVNWVLDADIAGFFDAIDHDWMIKFMEHRIGDRRILRLIRKWLTAGVSEEGQWSKTSVGTPQGAVISPLLGNVFLHYVFDLWIKWWRKDQCRGDVVVIRYADDFVIGFEHQDEAEGCLEQLHQRFAKFGLKLHSKKTRLIEFGKHAKRRRAQRGEGRPETFDFLGFTHKCAVTRARGRFTIHRHSISKRFRAKLGDLKEKLAKRMHRPLGETGRWLGRVVRGWLNYHAVPSNFEKLDRFIKEVRKLWLKAIRRRSQRGRRRWTWERFDYLSNLYLPKPKILHPYPHQRFRARLKVRAV